MKRFQVHFNINIAERVISFVKGGRSAAYAADALYDGAARLCRGFPAILTAVFCLRTR